MKTCFSAVRFLVLSATLTLLVNAHADRVPNPTVTAAARPFNASAPWLTYEIQRTTDLTAGWNSLTSVETSTAGMGQYLDPAPLQPNGFCRVVYP